MAVYSLGDKVMWMWEEFVKNTALVDLFKRHGLFVMISPHPGTYYYRLVIDFIFRFCVANKINKEIFVNDVFGAEEVMFPTLEFFATGYVSKKYAVCLYGTTEKDITDVITTGSCRSHSQNHFTIVRVDRNPENELRKMVNEIQLKTTNYASY